MLGPLRAGTRELDPTGFCQSTETMSLSPCIYPLKDASNFRALKKYTLQNKLQISWVSHLCVWKILDQMSGTLDSYFCQSWCFTVFSMRQEVQVAELQKVKSQPKCISKMILFCFQLKVTLRNNHVLLALVLWASLSGVSFVLQSSGQ